MYRLALLPLLLLLAAAPLSAQHALSSGGSYDPAVPTPSSVLGYEMGERFTPHHMLMRYLDRLAAASTRIRLDTVGRSFEGREVMMVIVTSEANQRRLEQIRADAARIADPRGATATDLAAVTARMPTIAWLGFTVHGPEASGAEAAIALLYQLAAGRDPETSMILDSVVVLIDPLQNPDGHERHAQDVMRMRTALGVPVHPDARIHGGTWPGPRTSHYYFDLNRDWYAMSHPETRGRTAAILRWWPHVAVDLHEMSSNSTYFFPPTMEPINKIVHPSILRWWDVYAEGLIRTFDQNGWSFFRREGYDEFYPGYGSSWPLYTGAVGMTFEQASSRGGAIRRTDGTVLTLREAARHHYGAAYSVLRTSAVNARARVRDYLAYRQSAISDALRSPLRAVVIERDDANRADSLAAVLLRNGIALHRTPAPITLAEGVEYGGGRQTNVRVRANSYVVDLAQPQGRLARALLEPDAPLDSSFIAEELERRRAGLSERFYDVTAWSLPLAFRVRAWGTSAMPTGVEELREHPNRGIVGTAPIPRYGWAFAPGSEASIRLLAGLLRDSVRVWFAPRSFSVGETRFPTGAFVVRSAANDSAALVNVPARAVDAGASVVPLQSSAVAQGTDLGSNSVFPVRPPRVAILSGAPVNGQSYGYAWYAFDQRLAYPSTAVDVDAVAGRALDDFNVLVVPSVSAAALSRALGDAGRERVAAWVRSGGTLVTLDAATDWLASERTGLSRLRQRSDTAARDTTPGAPLPIEVPGAIVRAIGDTLSPLLVGVRPREIPVLLSSDRVYQTPRDVRPGELVLRYAPATRLRVAGYLWPEAPARVANTPYLWTERVGRGRVIAFAGDPNFRDLWRGLMPLFANAVLLGPNY
jgi:hypothetical protein